ncbi:MAG: type I-E CRISPR-associated protein Cse2/CasB [Halothiobacillus sp.]|jgi:CRISPR system Cascade subunit CasB|nr:type I-E CRISPR-associated protein Cse2/CasB [Halothiobacillus sp.]
MMSEATTPAIATRTDTSGGSARGGKSLSFVDYVIRICEANKGVRAALRRADNPATEYQSWEFLAGFGVNLELDSERLPYATIAAAIAQTEPKKNGAINIGTGIARCYEKGSDQAQAKLRRLLACDNVPEACRIIRPLLRLIASRDVPPLNYAQLLDDLLWFGREESQTRIKARWAQDFYGRPEFKGDHK